MYDSYNPETTPDPSHWLTLDEQERILLIETYHKKAKIRLPNVNMHSVIHAIVENQIAENLPYVISAMARLSKQGLSRHDSIHAIGAVLTEHLFDLKATDSGEVINARYAAAIERLDGKAWLNSGS